MTTEKRPTPYIIPRSKHPISRKDIDREALKVMYRLRDAGFTAYLVGGGVRDLLLGKEPKDFDISTDARPGQIRKLFRNSRVIGRRFRLVQVFFHGNKIVEVSTFRRPSEYDLEGGNKVLPADNTFGTPAEDAFRRDLTINALFYEIENFSVIDYTGGMEDITRGVIRIIGDPEQRITGDPVRMMRAVRHAARSGFTVADTSWKAIVKHRRELNLCPVSRVRDELFKDLRGGACKAWARLAVDSGLFFSIFPFYEEILKRSPGRNERAKQLLDIFGTIDRLQARKLFLPDHVILALILVPWIQETLSPGEGYQPSEGYEQSRLIRGSLDEVLTHLNIKRADREAMAVLLAFLPLFQGDKQKTWPARIRRKSYFQDCRQFCEIYRESQGGEPAASLVMRPVPAKQVRKRKARTGRPALSSSRGGIFGLKPR